MTQAIGHSAVEVDLSNPGQFLACCGLLELASRLNSEARGWFADGRFRLTHSVADLLEAFTRCPVTRMSAGVVLPDTPSTDEDAGADGATDVGEENEGGQKEPKSPPVLLGPPFELRLDWWTDESAGEAGFKTWSAGMTIMGFFNGTITGKGDRRKQSPSMRQHLARHLTAGEGLFRSIEAIEKPSPFNFDSRLSRNVALDLGFVGNVTFAFSPAVELLALVGLQRFRPRMEVRWDRNSYWTWRDPLPVTIAAAVAHGLLPTLAHEGYAFAIKPRDAQGRYKAFGPALQERNTDGRQS